MATTMAGRSFGALGVRQDSDGRLAVVPAAGGTPLPILRAPLPPQVSLRLDGSAAVLGLRTHDGKVAARVDYTLGQLGASRFLALGRTSLWWMTPAWGTAAREVPEETQFLLLELPGEQLQLQPQQKQGGNGNVTSSNGNSNGCGSSSSSSSRHGTSYALLLPLIDSGAFRATLRSERNGGLGLRLESGAPDVTASAWGSALLVVAGEDPFEVVQRGVAAAARLSGTAKHRSEKEVPAGCDVFGWCTWDAFYSKVSASGIHAGLESLVAGGAPPKLLIIDDGWQRTDVDPHFRLAAAAPGSIDSGVAVAEAAQEEAIEAAAALLSGPDDNLGETLHASHQLEAEDRKQADQAAMEGAEGAGGGGGSGQRSDDQPGQQQQQQKQQQETGQAGQAGGASAGSGRTWAQAAWAVVAHLETAFFNACRRLLEATPADHFLMRVITALATSRWLRDPLLRFYAASSDHSRRLVSIKANAKFGGPEADAGYSLNSDGEDLGSVVAALKRQHGLTWVYCWHALPGFWGGVGLADPDMAKYKPELVKPTPTPGTLSVDPSLSWLQPVLSGVGLPGDPASLHGDMHAYLAACGVDGVKVDVQSVVGLLGSGAGRGGGPALAAAYHASLEASAAAHFPQGNHVINCMCHSSENLYSMQRSNLARVSDDFYPLNAASHTAHIVNCAYNSLLMGELVVPDWDMFHSEHAKALLHATARAVSGGPVYVSDRPGRHDFQLLRRLVLPDGGVLRCLLPARPTADCLFADVGRDGGSVLKLWNANPYTALVACFNLQGASWSRALRRFHTHDGNPGSLSARVSAEDVPAAAFGQPAAAAGAEGSELFAAYVDSTQELVLLPAGAVIDVALPGGGGSDVVTLSPVAQAAAAATEAGGGGGVQLAPIGLIGMLNPGGAVLGCAFSGGHSDDGYEVQPARASLQLRGAGTVLCYASHPPTSVSVAGQEVAFEYVAPAAALRFELPALGSASSAKDCTLMF